MTFFTAMYKMKNQNMVYLAVFMLKLRIKLNILLLGLRVTFEILHFDLSF